MGTKAIIDLINVLFNVGILIIGIRAWYYFNETMSLLKQWNLFYNYIIDKQIGIELKDGLTLGQEEDLKKFVMEIKHETVPESRRNLYVRKLITEKYAYNINKMFNAAHSDMEQLPNLGLLGTVLGLVIGYWYFEPDKMTIVISCFQTALWTTLVGLGFMIFLKILRKDSDTETEFEKFQTYTRQIEQLCELDKCIFPDELVKKLLPDKEK